MKSIQLGDCLVTESSEPYVIAEIGVNHEGSLELAKRLIELAKEGGADAAKFQTYKAETIASRHSPYYWDLAKEPTRSQFDLFKKYDKFGEKEYTDLAQHCLKVGIEFVSTPFDARAVEFLAPWMPFFKVASADLTNTPFLRQIAGKGKPVVLSTGCATLGEIDSALHTLQRAGGHDIALLHCILNYPTANANARLGMIRGLRHAYPSQIIGYSDHTLPDEGMTPLCTAYLLGAVILEKHFTHDKTLPGNDHYHAMDADDLKRFRQHVNALRELVGPSDHKEPIPSEAVSRKNARRSIVLAGEVGRGSPLTEHALTCKRPGTGISPDHWDEVLGRKAARDLPPDTVLQWSDLE